MTMPTPVIEYIAPAKLTPYADNARRHPPEQIRQIAEAIQRLGFINPVVVDAQGVIIAGHGRYEAAKSLGLKKVPVVRLSHLSDEQARLMRIEDNALASASHWDLPALYSEIDRLAASSEASIQGLLRTFDPESLFADAVPPAASGAAPVDDADEADEGSAPEHGDGGPSKAPGVSYEAGHVDSDPELIPSPAPGSLVIAPDLSSADAPLACLDDPALSEAEREFLRVIADTRTRFFVPPDFAAVPRSLWPQLRLCFLSPVVISGGVDNA